jgi:FkbH-like protein
VRIPNPNGTTPYLQKITFKQWAKLWTLANVRCYPLRTADFAERLNTLIGSAAHSLPLPKQTHQKVLTKIAYIRRQQLAERVRGKTSIPDCFVVEIYNPNATEVRLTFSVKQRGESARKIFKRSITALPQFTRERIPFGDISDAVETGGTFEVELLPNDPENVTLYFGLLDFVKEKSVIGAGKSSHAESVKCKCVVWDLDNTVWNGVLIEDGPEGVRLRDGVVDVIATLDSRGILQSIASKNNHDDAMQVLEKFQIAEYFLFPQIHWQPKSASVAAVAAALNIGLDTLMFVDDQEFERQEVAAAHPQVGVIDALEVAHLTSRRECQVPVTEESRTRRAMYSQQQQRAAAQNSYGGDYVTFLKSSQTTVVLERLDEKNLERVYELAQRTNQMNFSGKRYSRAELELIMRDRSRETFVLRCSDRFGSYGIVGFALVDLQEPRLLDLMFSCRVQGKRIEHNFLAWLLERHFRYDGRDFLANLRKTPRNGPGSAVFAELGFGEIATSEGVTSLRYQKDLGIPDERIIEIDAKGLDS